MRTTTPAVVGLDYSLTSSGVALSPPTRVTLIQSQQKGHPRLHELKMSLRHLAKGAALAVVESGSYRSTSSTFHQLAGGWHILTHELWELGIPYAEVAPSTLKAYATDDGHATKQQMVNAARRAFPRTPVVNDDAADALFLAAMGSEYLGRPLFRSPRTGALRSVNWPRVGTKPATPSDKAKREVRKKARKATRTRKGGNHERL